MILDNYESVFCLQVWSKVKPWKKKQNRRIVTLGAIEFTEEKIQGQQNRNLYILILI